MTPGPPEVLILSSADSSCDRCRRSGYESCGNSSLYMDVAALRSAHDQLISGPGPYPCIWYLTSIKTLMLVVIDLSLKKTLRSSVRLQNIFSFSAVRVNWNPEVDSEIWKQIFHRKTLKLFYPMKNESAMPSVYQRIFVECCPTTNSEQFDES